MKNYIFFFCLILVLPTRADIFEPRNAKITYEIIQGHVYRNITHADSMDKDMFIPPGRISGAFTKERLFYVGPKKFSSDELQSLAEQGFIIKNLEDSAARYGWWPILLKRKIFRKYEVIEVRNSKLQTRVLVSKPSLSSDIPFVDLFFSFAFIGGVFSTSTLPMRKLKLSEPLKFFLGWLIWFLPLFPIRMYAKARLAMEIYTDIFVLWTIFIFIIILCQVIPRKKPGETEAALS